MLDRRRHGREARGSFRQPGPSARHSRDTFPRFVHHRQRQRGSKDSILCGVVRPIGNWRVGLPNGAPRRLSARCCKTRSMPGTWKKRRRRRRGSWRTAARGRPARYRPTRRRQRPGPRRGSTGRRYRGRRSAAARYGSAGSDADGTMRPRTRTALEVLSPDRCRGAAPSGRRRTALTTGTPPATAPAQRPEIASRSTWNSVRSSRRTTRAERMADRRLRPGTQRQQVAMSSPASRGKASKPSKGSTDDEACDEIGPEALPAPGAPVDEQLSHSLDFLRHPQPRHNPTNAQALQMAANDDDDRPSSKYGALASEDAKAAAREINAEIGGVIDAHFHMWTLMDSPRPFSAYLTADLRKFGLPYPPRRPGQAPPDDKIRARLQDYSRQYGTAEFNVRDYSSRDYLEDAVRCGVKLLGSTYMQCGWEGPDEGETAWAEKVRGNTGGIVATSIVGTVDMLGEPEAVEKTLRAHMAASPHFRGIRDMHLARGRREPERLADPRCLRNIATLERLGLVLDITAYQWSFPAIFEVVNKFPKMTFILDHMGPPVSIFDKQSEWDTWKTGLLAIAACPNVYVKLSCLMPVIGSRFHLDPTLPSGSAIAASKFGTMMRIALAAFGPRRCMWASNFPSDRGSAGWGELMAACWQVLKEEGVDAEGRRRVMRGTAEQVYRIAVPWDAAKL